MFDEDRPFIPDEEFYRRIGVADEAKRFVEHSRAGQDLLESAIEDWKNAVYDFDEMSVETIMAHPEKVADIKTRMNVAKKFILWTTTTAIQSRAAEVELQARDEADETID